MNEDSGAKPSQGGLDHIRSFVRRAGRMTEHQREAYGGLSQAHCLEFKNERLDLDMIFGRPGPKVLEIGFGMGQATALIAQASPDTDFLGIEVHRPGIGKLMSEIEERGLSNIKIIEADAVEVLKLGISEESLSGIHLFFPDPWPKKRHHKRRIMSPEFALLAASRLAVGAYLYMVTDWEEYALSALEVMQACPLLVPSCPGFSQPIPWRPLTKFERKARAAGRQIRELYFLKSASA